MALVIIFLGQPVYAEWGSIIEAESLYTERKSEFDRIYDVVRRHRELKNISPAHDPYRSTEFISNYGEFTEATKAAYVQVLGIMKDLGLERVRVSRFPALSGGQMEIVSFVVFDRGLGPWSEGIVIERVEGADSVEISQSEETVCKPIEEPLWYVCHSR